MIAILNNTSTTGPPATPAASGNRGTSLLIWTFTIFNFLRILAYLPSIEAILVTGESAQHSLLTWLIFFGANVTMCCWLYAEAGRRFNQRTSVEEEQRGRNAGRLRGWR